MSGFQLPFGIQPVNPVAVDYWSGPYTATTLSGAISAANAAIPSGVRFQTLEVRLLVGSSAPYTTYKYWYSTGTSDSDLKLFQTANSVTGIGTSGYVAFWDSPSTITGNSGFVWDNSNNILTITGDIQGSTLKAGGAAGVDYTNSISGVTLDGGYWGVFQGRLDIAMPYNVFTNTSGPLPSINITAPLTAGAIDQNHGNLSLGIATQVADYSGSISSLEIVDSFVLHIPTLTSPYTSNSTSGLAFGSNTGIIKFLDSSAERARFQAGSLLIGTSSNINSSYLLQVNSDILINGIRIGTGSGTDDTSVLIGATTGSSITTGKICNVCIGYLTGSSITSATHNTIIGTDAGWQLTSGLGNTLYGNGSGSSLTTGYQNTFIGISSGNVVTTGYYNTILGNYYGSSGMHNNVILADGQGNRAYQWDGTNHYLYSMGNGSYSSILYYDTSTGLVKYGALPSFTSPNSVTFDSSGSGGASGSTFNGSSALTVSYNTIGAQASSTILTTLSGLSNTSGYLQNNGSGTLSWGSIPSGSISLTGDVSGTGTTGSPVTVSVNKLLGSSIPSLSTGYLEYNGISLVWTTPSSVTSSQWTNLTSPTTTIYYSAGNVLIGTSTDASSGVLQVTGNQYVTGNITASGTITATAGGYDSDIRLKRNILYNPKIEKIDEIKIASYTINNEFHYGYIAQDIEKIIPSAIIKKDDGFLAVQYHEVLVAKVQYLENTIDELKSVLTKNNLI